MEEDRSARRDWCDANAINFRTISRAVEVRGQLRHYLRQFKQAGVVLASCGQDVDALGRAILAGYFSNVARLQPDGNYRKSRDTQRYTEIHRDTQRYTLHYSLSPCL